MTRPRLTPLERLAGRLLAPEMGRSAPYVAAGADLPGGRLPDGTHGVASLSLDLVAEPALRASGRWRGRRPAVAVSPRPTRGDKWVRTAARVGVLVHELGHVVQYITTFGRGWWRDHPADRTERDTLAAVYSVSAAHFETADAGPADRRRFWQGQISDHPAEWFLAVAVLQQRAESLGLHPGGMWCSPGWWPSSLADFRRLLPPVDPWQPIPGRPVPAAFADLWRADAAHLLDTLTPAVEAA